MDPMAFSMKSDDGDARGPVRRHRTGPHQDAEAVPPERRAAARHRHGILSARRSGSYWAISMDEQKDRATARHYRRR